MAREYYHTKESVEEYTRLAKDVNGSELIGKLKQFLPSNSNLLELGTGPGADWKILRVNYNVIGSDYSKEFLLLLAANNPDGTFLELNAITLKTNKKFDGIYSNKVLHHLKESELIDSVKRQHEILSQDGIICHSFWEGEGSEVFKGLYVNYHKESTLTQVFETHFDTLMIESYNEFEDADSLLFIGKKKHINKT